MIVVLSSADEFGLRILRAAALSSLERKTLAVLVDVATLPSWTSELNVTVPRFAAKHVVVFAETEATNSSLEETIAEKAKTALGVVRGMKYEAMRLVLFLQEKFTNRAIFGFFKGVRISWFWI